jgi:hypothetical protein
LRQLAIRVDLERALIRDVFLDSRHNDIVDRIVYAILANQTFVTCGLPSPTGSAHWTAEEYRADTEA